MQINEIDIEKYTSLSIDRKISFMQSPNWATFKSQVSNYTYMFYEIKDDSNLAVGSFSVLIKPKAILGKIIQICYIPKVILFNNPSENAPQNISEVLKLLKNKYSLILVEFNSMYFEDNNILTDNIEFNNSLSSISGYSKTNLEIQPKSTVVNDVTNVNDLEEFLQKLSSHDAKKNVRKALKYMYDNEITFEVKDKLSDDELNQAYTLFENVYINSNFKGRTLDYYKKLQNVLSDSVVWYTMKKEGKLVLVNLAIKDLNTKTSNDLYVGKNIDLEKGAISYALKFLSFKYLSGIGYKYYDHWGVYLDPASTKYGFSEFKMKFKGNLIQFLPIFAYSKYIPTFLLNLVLKIVKNVNL